MVIELFLTKHQIVLIRILVTVTSFCLLLPVAVLFCIYLFSKHLVPPSGILLLYSVVSFITLSLCFRWILLTVCFFERYFRFHNNFFVSFIFLHSFSTTADDLVTYVLLYLCSFKASSIRIPLNELFSAKSYLPFDLHLKLCLSCLFLLYLLRWVIYLELCQILTLWLDAYFLNDVLTTLLKYCISVVDLFFR